MSEKIVIATRESPLALWQAEHVKTRLEAAHPDIEVSLLGMTSRGDQLLDKPLFKVGGKGLFVKELETALLDERSKRQELQRQIDELNGRFTQLNQPTEPEKVEEPVDFLDDPEKWANNLEAKYEQRLQEIQYQNSLQRLQDFERIAKESHPDYDEAIQFFAQAAQHNSALQMEAAQASNPAEYAYRLGKRLAQINAAGGDFDAFVQQQREAAVAEYLQKNPTPASRAADVPESLSTVTGATQRTDKEPTQTPLESMFNNF